MLAHERAQHLVGGALHELARVMGLEHGKAGVNTQVEGMAPEDARAHAVDGGDPGAVHGKGLGLHTAFAQALANLLLDLVGRQMGEGDDQHLVEVRDVRPAIGTGAGHERPCDALGQGRRLA